MQFTPLHLNVLWCWFIFLNIAILSGLKSGATEEDKTRCFGSKVRCCTDIVFLILLIAFCLGMLVVMYVASEKADLNRCLLLSLM